ncbi:unnamed protein product [Ectocarpus sp. 4 AP-2014]
MLSTDRDALTVLYNATGGSNWVRKTNWNTGAAFSQWRGSKGNDQGRVVELDLMGNNLRGAIVPELGGLSALTRLDLQRNQLAGSIPPEVGNLAALQYLDFRANALSGPIPPEVGNLTALHYLYLHRNKLSGPIPPELGNVAALCELYLSQNQLGGPIPNELGALSELKKLDLGDNNLTGPIPPELGNLTWLNSLNLKRNQLSGSIPPELGNLSFLLSLELQNNRLSVLPRATAERFAAQQRSYHRNSWEENPWKEPPADVMGLGMAYAAKYLKDLDDYGRTLSNRLKVVLVGLANAGKTSVAIRLGRPVDERLPTPDERTVGVEIRDVRLGPGPATDERVVNSDLDVKLWDFAGQRAYYDTHQMFLTPGALFVLVVDIFAYSVKNSSEDALGQWLDILQSRVPGSVVLLVGTHTDSFVTPTECRERMECFKKDVREARARIQRECASAQERTQADLRLWGGEGSTDSGGNQHGLYQPLRVVEEVLALNLRSRGEEEIDQLQELIERVAYNGYDGYSFPAVRSVVSKPYLHAFATLEAIRRGVTLRGSGGESAEVARRLLRGYSEEERPFIRFSDALCSFRESVDEESWVAEASGQKSEEGVFVRAIQLFQAQGVILLTHVDGGGQNGRDVGVNLVVHVSPAWFADLVRRIVDVRLLQPLQQGPVYEALEAFRPATLQLSHQHQRFFEAGEVSTDYLKFLWLRDMGLGPGTVSTRAPPLKMTEEDIKVMVESLVDVRFMFPVRDEHGGVVRDRYVVASCLPDHVGYDVNPRKMLQLQEGGAIFSQKLTVVGARAVPPGLVPRLLAWCGRGDARIEVCWKSGVSFAFKNHLVLVYECRDAEGASSIECHAMGSAHNESAGRALSEVVKELGLLVSDPHYGFRGIRLFVFEKVVKYSAYKDDQLQFLIEGLKDHMNMKFEELERKSETIAEGIRKRLDELDPIAAVASKCLLVSIRGEVPCPRLVVVEPDLSPAPPLAASRSRFSHFRREMMDALLRTMGQSPRVCLRIRFLCAHDLSAAICGEDGRGYKLEFKQWQQWLRKCLPLFQVSLWLLRVGMSVVTRADVLPVNDMMGKLREVAGEEAVGCIESLDLESWKINGGDLASNVGEKTGVFGTAYADLVKFVLQEEEKIASDTRLIQDPVADAMSGVSDPVPVASRWCRFMQLFCGCSQISGNNASGRASGTSAVPSSTVRSAGRHSFETDMVLASRQRGPHAPECAWVRNDNLNAWKSFEKTNFALSQRSSKSFEKTSPSLSWCSSSDSVKFSDGDDDEAPW